MGTVRNAAGEAIPHAKLMIWQTSSSGVYDLQEGDGSAIDYRGVFRADAAGKFHLRTVRPLGYSIPMDGPVGDLVREPTPPNSVDDSRRILAVRRWRTPSNAHLGLEQARLAARDLHFGAVAKLRVQTPIHPQFHAFDEIQIDDLPAIGPEEAIRIETLLECR